MTSAALLSVDTECAQVDDDGDCKIVHLAGDIDLHTIDTLHRAVGNEPDPEISALIVDLSEVGFCCSAGLRALLQLRDRADLAGIPLELVITGGRLRRTLNVLGDLDDFSVHPDLRSAQEWLRPSWAVATLHGMPAAELSTWPCRTGRAGGRDAPRLLGANNERTLRLTYSP